jgi:uncharacterized membrane protein YhiD involved in acid resistance
VSRKGLLVSLFASLFMALAGLKTHALDQIGACSLAHISAYMRKKAAAMTATMSTKPFREGRLFGEAAAQPQTSDSS